MNQCSSFGVLASFAATLICGSGAFAQVAESHPNPQNLRVRGPVETISRAQTTTGARELEAFATRLSKLTRVDSLGTADGAPETVLGRIRDVIVDSTGRIFVLDDSFLMVRVFSAAGRPEFTIGQQGGGPLDFRFPLAGWIENDSTLAVIDAILGTKYITARRASAVRLQRVVPPPAAITGGCATRGLLYNYTTSAPPVRNEHRVVRAYDRQGHAVRSFGAAYESESRLVRDIMTEGTIACLPDGTTMHALSTRTPIQR